MKEDILANFSKISIDRKKTGEQIKKFISESNLTYEQLSSILGLKSSRVIYEWIKGTKIPSLENLINLCVLLEVELKQILKINK